MGLKVKNIAIILLAALLFFLVLPVAFSQTPWLINDLDAKVTFSGKINLDYGSNEDGYAHTVKATLYSIPQTTTGQNATLVRASPKDYELETDEYGNKRVVFTWYSPKKSVLDYYLEWDVTSEHLKFAIDSIGEFPPDEDINDIYLKPSNLTAWNKYISTKANSLTKESGTSLDAVRRLVDWISDYVHYDYSLVSTGSFSAKEVFLTRSGVCDEFTNLFISMAKSVGIPARYVEGLVYSGKEWNYHAWAEVYIDGRWLPVDPTYNEVGFIDSSHITLAKAPSDEYIFHKLWWEGHGATANFLKTDFEIENVVETPRNLISLDFNLPDGACAQEVIKVDADLTNLANSHLVAACALNMPEEMHLLSAREQTTLIAPKGTSTVSWNLSTPAGLDEQWIHMMPIQVTCFPGGTNVTKQLEVDPRNKSGGTLSARVEDVVYLSEGFVMTKTRNTGNAPLGDIEVVLCYGETCEKEKAGTIKPGNVSTVFFEGITPAAGQSLVVSLNSSQIDSFNMHSGNISVDLASEDESAEGGKKETLPNESGVTEGSELSETKTVKGWDLMIPKSRDEQFALIITATIAIIVVVLIIRAAKKR